MVAGVGAGAGGGWLCLSLGLGGFGVGHCWRVGGGRDGWMGGGRNSIGLLLSWEVHRFSMDGDAQERIGNKYDGEIPVRRPIRLEQKHFRRK